MMWRRRLTNSLRLHTKTTLLASAITLIVLAAMFIIISARVADLVREEQKALAELQAINLAQQISQMPAPRQPEEMAQAATLARGARPGIISVRIWQRVGGVFVETAAAAGSAPAEEIPEETKDSLRSGLASRVVSALPSKMNGSVYRVFAPITEEGRVSGAVEIVEKLDDAPSVAVRYQQTAIWISLLAVTLITLSTYLLFRHLIYRPIEALLSAMARAEAGDLKAQAPVRASDELGQLSEGFNRMIARIRAMSEERERQKQLLEERVREATAELQRRNQQLEATNRELWRMARRITELERLAAAGQTAAQIAHEVGTPLNLISGHVQLLRASIDDARATSRLDIISEQIERIERIVRRTLDRTRQEASIFTHIDMSALLRRILNATAPVLDARNIELKTDLAPDLPPIAGDADRLQQAFINLINNALDAMAEGGALTVRTRVERNADEEVIIEIADTGCGMAEEVRAHIFEPFYTTKERGRGAGLGLLIVQQVVREHGGQIEVESAPQRGTLFRLRFPRARSAD
jgi:signal transduction histidine kinase